MCVNDLQFRLVLSSHNPSHMVASPSFMALTPLGSTAPRASTVPDASLALSNGIN